jgi:hypothetical protein
VLRGTCCAGSIDSLISAICATISRRSNSHTGWGEPTSGQIQRAHQPHRRLSKSPGTGPILPFAGMKSHTLNGRPDGDRP